MRMASLVTPSSASATPCAIAAIRNSIGRMFLGIMSTSLETARIQPSGSRREWTSGLLQADQLHQARERRVFARDQRAELLGRHVRRGHAELLARRGKSGALHGSANCR